MEAQQLILSSPMLFDPLDGGRKDDPSRALAMEPSTLNCAYNDHYKNSGARAQGKLPMKSRSQVRAPSTVKRTVPRGRLPNAEYRTREYLTEREVERLMKAAGNNRHGHRDATMILIAFRHGLRASELCSLRWEQVDLVHGRLHVHRLKKTSSAIASSVAASLGRRSAIPAVGALGQRQPSLSCPRPWAAGALTAGTSHIQIAFSPCRRHQR